MVNRFLPLFLLHFFVLGVSAQPTIEWQRCLGGTELEELYACHQTVDGGYIVGGYTSSFNGDVTGNHGAIDYWVVKLAPDGAIDWKKAYGGTNIDWLRTLAPTTDGGYILAGSTNSNNGNVSGNHGDKDAWIVKLDSNGSIQWQKCLGGSGWDEAWDIKQTPDGGYIMAGQTNSSNGDVGGTNGGSMDYWVVKLSTLGEITWESTYGGSIEDNAKRVLPTMDGGYIVVGEAYSSDGDMVGQHGNGDYGVIKIDNNGGVIWQKMLGGSSVDWASDVVLTADGGYLIIGNSTSVNGDITAPKGKFDIWLVTLDANGGLINEHSLGGSKDDRAYGMSSTSDGNILIAGSTFSTDGDVSENDGLLDFWVVKATTLGEIIWETTVGGELGEYSFAITPTNDNGCMTVGLTYSNGGDVTGQHGPAGYADGWVVKLSPASVSTSQPATPALTLTPNPAGSSVVLNFPYANTASEVVLHDLLGREVLRENMTGNELNISRLAPGVYQVSATSVDGKRAVGKLIKQ